MTKQDKNMSIRINQELLEKYKNFCEKHGYSMSKRLKNFIKQELKKDE